MRFYQYWLAPLLFLLDEERSHKLAVKSLKSGFLRPKAVVSVKLQQEKAGLFFPNPLGLAAGFDKNGEIADKILRLGFGSCEIGTVTPLAQDGQIRPRLFRLIEEQAIINRMGFNNRGMGQIYDNLAQAKAKITSKSQGTIGVNLGANKDSPDPIEDYVTGLGKFYDLADYFTINISSPNTPGLRDLQNQEYLPNLLAALGEKRSQLAQQMGRSVPIFLKISPDLSADELEPLAMNFEQAALEGLIISNTTISRKNLYHKLAREQGGLSGKPLFRRSTIMLAKFRKLLGRDKLLIGAGGVSDMSSFISKIAAGADLVQLYSALVYKGPFLAKSILQQSLAKIEREGVKHISAYRDSELDYWAGQNLN